MGELNYNWENILKEEGGGGRDIMSLAVQTFRLQFPSIPVPSLFLLTYATLVFFNCKMSGNFVYFFLFVPLSATLVIPLNSPPLFPLSLLSVPPPQPQHTFASTVLKNQKNIIFFAAFRSLCSHMQPPLELARILSP